MPRLVFALWPSILLVPSCGDCDGVEDGVDVEDDSFLAARYETSMPESSELLSWDSGIECNVGMHLGTH
jgi:hypothetical protein